MSGPGGEMGEDLPWDLIGIEGGPFVSHGPAKCATGWCCIHNPSDHPLQTAPLAWNPTLWVMGRRCRHDIVHPDVDSLGYLAQVGGVDAGAWRAAHRCDGCCMGRPGWVLEDG